MNNLSSILRHLYAVRRPFYLMVLVATVANLMPGLWSLPFWTAFVLFAVDTYARLEFSDRLESYLQRHDGDPGPFDKRLSSSWCGRGVMTAHLPDYADVYAARGYRWWHILPDDGLRSFTRKNFWLRAFGLDAFLIDSKGNQK